MFFRIVVLMLKSVWILYKFCKAMYFNYKFTETFMTLLNLTFILFIGEVIIVANLLGSGS